MVRDVSVDALDGQHDTRSKAPGLDEGSISMVMIESKHTHAARCPNCYALLPVYLQTVNECYVVEESVKRTVSWHDHELNESTCTNIL